MATSGTAERSVRPHDNTMSRRRFLGALGGAAAAVALPRLARAAGRRRPNIVLVMADDMGFSDVGCYGGEIDTPNLDRLAAGGIRFTQFWNAARCSPSRASLLTGLYAHQAGMGWNGDLGVPAYLGRLNDRCVTVAEVLRGHGYRTLMSGKWHVGHRRPYWPVDRGFERSYVLIRGASSYFRPGDGELAEDDRELPAPKPPFYITDAFTDRAVAFIDEYGRRPEPFFLYVAYTAPHWPLHALPEDIDRYRGRFMKGWDVLRQERHRRQIEMGIVDPRWELTPRDRPAPAWEEVEDREAWDLKMAVYAAQIDRMDRGIGRIMAKLRDVGAEENTLVMFLSDNGGCMAKVDRGKPGVPPGSADSFRSYGLPWANASNTPFRRYKIWVHEGGIATPFIARWPAVIRGGGAITHEPGHIIDLMATCLDAAGAEYPRSFRGREILPLEGASLLPLLEGRRREGHPVMYWEHVGNRAVRQGKWKLVARGGREWELYNMEADRTEMHDLAARQPERAAELAALYERWAERWGVLPKDEFKVLRNRRRKGR